MPCGAARQLTQNPFDVSGNRQITRFAREVTQRQQESLTGASSATNTVNVLLMPYSVCSNVL